MSLSIDEDLDNSTQEAYQEETAALKNVAAFLLTRREISLKWKAEQESSNKGEKVSEQESRGTTFGSELKQLLSDVASGRKKQVDLARFMTAKYDRIQFFRDHLAEMNLILEKGKGKVYSWPEAVRVMLKMPCAGLQEGKPCSRCQTLHFPCPEKAEQVSYDI